MGTNVSDNFIFAAIRGGNSNLRGKLLKLNLRCTNVSDAGSYICQPGKLTGLLPVALAQRRHDTTTRSAPPGVRQLKLCSSLHHLGLSWCDQVTNVDALGACTSLSVLDLRNTNVACIAALSALSRLRTLLLDRTEVKGTVFKKFNFTVQSREWT